VPFRYNPLSLRPQVYRTLRTTPPSLLTIIEQTRIECSAGSAKNPLADSAIVRLLWFTMTNNLAVAGIALQNFGTGIITKSKN
jgi:hypothetical protein